jgi:hypothetical protein
VNDGGRDVEYNKHTLSCGRYGTGRLLLLPVPVRRYRPPNTVLPDVTVIADRCCRTVPPLPMVRERRLRRAPAGTDVARKRFQLTLYYTVMTVIYDRAPADQPEGWTGRGPTEMQTAHHCFVAYNQIKPSPRRVHDAEQGNGTKRRPIIIRY